MTVNTDKAVSTCCIFGCSIRSGDHAYVHPVSLKRHTLLTTTHGWTHEHWALFKQSSSELTQTLSYKIKVGVFIPSTLNSGESPVLWVSHFPLQRQKRQQHSGCPIGHPSIKDCIYGKMSVSLDNMNRKLTSQSSCFNQQNNGRWESSNLSHHITGIV